MSSVNIALANLTVYHRLLKASRWFYQYLTTFIFTVKITWISLSNNSTLFHIINYLSGCPVTVWAVIFSKHIQIRNHEIVQIILFIDKGIHTVEVWTRVDKYHVYISLWKMATVTRRAIKQVLMKNYLFFLSLCPFVWIKVLPLYINNEGPTYIIKQ